MGMCGVHAGNHHTMATKLRTVSLYVTSVEQATKFYEVYPGPSHTLACPVWRAHRLCCRPTLTSALCIHSHTGLLAVSPGRPEAQCNHHRAQQSGAAKAN